VFQSVWWLRQCEPEFLQTLAAYMDREAFAAEEKIPSVEDNGEPRMCILDQGLCSRGGAILTSGAFWGDLLISSPTLRDLRVAKAMGYCEIVTLARHCLDEALLQYPESQKLIREAGLKLATQRAIIVISMYARLKHNRERRQRAASPAMYDPSIVLQDMRRNDLMPSVEWREVTYVSTSDNKAGKKPVALSVEADGTEPGSPGVDGKAPDDTASATSFRGTKPSPGPNGSPARVVDNKQLSALVQQQKVEAQMIHVMSDEIKLVHDKLGRIEALLSSGKLAARPSVPSLRKASMSDAEFDKKMAASFGGDPMAA